MAISGICREITGISAVYIGNLSEAVYYPPDPQDVPELMKSWLGEVNIEAATVKEIFEKIAVSAYPV